MPKKDKYPKVISQLANLKELNKHMKNLCLAYTILDNGFVLLRSNLPVIEKIGYIHNHEDYSEFYYHMINPKEATSFLAKYTKTNVEDSKKKDFRFLADPHKGVILSMGIEKPPIINYFYDSMSLPFDLREVMDFPYNYLSEDTIRDLSEKKLVELHDEDGLNLVINRSIFGWISDKDTIGYCILPGKINEYHKRKILFQYRNNLIDIYGICAFLDYEE